MVWRATVNLREERVSSGCRKSWRHLRGGTIIQEPVGEPPEIAMTIIFHNLCLLVLESLGRLLLEAAVSAEERQKLGCQGLDGGAVTLSLSPT